jgi:hypothetical protein
MTIIEDEVEKIREIRRGIFERLNNDPCKILGHFGKRSKKRAAEAGKPRRPKPASAIREDDNSGEN